MKLKLVEKNQEVDDVWSFSFEPESPLTWIPGQYLHYDLPHNAPDDRKQDRYFTISTAPFELNPRITTRIVSDHPSSFKITLSDLGIGSIIEASGPEGGFTVDNVFGEYVFMAGGIGITPFRSILAQLDHDYAEINVRLLYSGRADNYPFADELDAIAKRNDNFKITYIQDPVHIEQPDILKAKNELKNPKFYVSGPEPMVEHYKALLIEMGNSEESIKGDYFPGYNWSKISVRGSLPQ